MRASIAELERLSGELDGEQLAWRPDEAAWSVAQIVEHLWLTDAPSVEPLERLLASARREDAQWKPTLMGRLVNHAVAPQTRRKTKAGKPFVPSAQPRDGVIGDYIEIRKRLLT